MKCTNHFQQFILEIQELNLAINVRTSGIFSLKVGGGGGGVSPNMILCKQDLTQQATTFYTPCKVHLTSPNVNDISSLPSQVKTRGPMVL